MTVEGVFPTESQHEAIAAALAEEALFFLREGVGHEHMESPNAAPNIERFAVWPEFQKSTYAVLIGQTEFPINATHQEDALSPHLLFKGVIGPKGQTYVKVLLSRSGDVFAAREFIRGYAHFSPEERLRRDISGMTRKRGEF